MTDPPSLPSYPPDVTVVIDVSAAGWRPSGSSATRIKIIATFKKGRQEKKNCLDYGDEPGERRGICLRTELAY